MKLTVQSLHKVWLDNEYSLWVKALQESTVHNFKENPVVKRMLGEVEIKKFQDAIPEAWLNKIPWGLVYKIDAIGTGLPLYESGVCMRMIYYAQKVLACNPTSIVEIGGGVGQFYAILRALGYGGEYKIYDLHPVKQFVYKYLDEVQKQTGLRVGLDAYPPFDYCVSLYALGEFDDDLKKYYIDKVVRPSPHGLIVWNPHSGASADINFPCKIEDEYPLTAPGNKLCTW